MPKVVGQTAAGDPIFEVRSVPLVLRDGAAHFNRVVACSKCERDVPGPPVLGPTELNRPLQAVICRDCVRAGTQPAPPAGHAADAADPAPPARPVDDDARLASLEQQVTELAELVQAAAAQTQSDLARFTLDTEARGRALQGLTQRMDSVDERLVQQAPSSTVSLGAVEDRIRHLELGLDVGAARAEKDSAARLRADNDLLRIEEQLNQRLDGLADRARRTADADGLEALERRAGEAVEGHPDGVQPQVGLGAAIEQVRAAVAPVGPELARLDEQLNQRLDRVAEREARMAESERARLAEADRHVREAVDQVSEALVAMRRDLQADLQDGLAGMAESLPKPAPDTADRLRSLEEAVVERDAELDELHDLHAALDMGMGELRSGIVAGRAADDRLTDALEEVYRRLETVSLAQAEARAEQGRGWRSGRRSGDSTTESAAGVAAIEDLIREQHQLKAQVAGLQQAADTATKAAARASSQAAAVGPVRTDVRVLHTKLAEQKEAVATLGRTVERLRRSVPNPRTAAAKKAPRTTKS